MKSSVDNSYRLLAAEHVRRQVKALARQLKGLRCGKDTECVHRARVASRRLRTALGMLCDCFPEKKVRRWRKAIRRLAVKLGEARDLDVQILFVAGFLGKLRSAAQRPGIARLLERLTERRAALQPHVARAARDLESSGVLDEMRAASKKIRRSAERGGATVRSPLVFRQALRHVRRKLAQFQSYEDCLADPADQACHHAMRIAVKQLRYTMEVCQPPYGGRLNRFIAAAETMQTLLGDIRDSDVWAMDLQAFLRDEREPAGARQAGAEQPALLRAGIEHLVKDRRTLRCKRFRQLQTYWHRLDRRAFWQDLVRALQAPLGSRQRSPSEGDEYRVN